MEDNHLIQNILHIIDTRITEKISLQELASLSGYSTFHLNRLFSRIMGITLKAYVVRRKLQYALRDLNCNEKIHRIADKYGFETHAGFTKAFKKYFGYPPSLYPKYSVIVT